MGSSRTSCEDSSLAYWNPNTTDGFCLEHNLWCWFSIFEKNKLFKDIQPNFWIEIWTACNISLIRNLVSYEIGWKLRLYRYVFKPSFSWHSQHRFSLSQLLAHTLIPLFSSFMLDILYMYTIFRWLKVASYRDSFESYAGKVIPFTILISRYWTNYDSAFN